MREAFAAQCPELQNRPYLLFLSRIHDKKGVDLLLTAFAQLNRLCPSAYVPPHLSPTQDRLQEAPALVIAGPGLDTVYGQRLRRFAAEEAANLVFFPGMLTGEAKWGAFYGCQAFVLPSHQENFGIAVVEAMACGKPVLISNQVNIWREIEAAKGGLVEDDTVIGVQRLLANWQALTESEKQAMGVQAQAAYENLFAVSQAAKKMGVSLRQK
jgi:glycosyltransferase involved in cell wall biosynthesis